MRNGPERFSCLCRAMKLWKKLKRVGVVKRQVVEERWRRKGREAGERRGRAERTAPAEGRARRDRAGMPRSNSAGEIISFVRSSKHLGEAGQ